MNGELRAMLIKHYQQYVTNEPNIPLELKKALNTNERVPAFIDNLAKEFSAPYFKQVSNNQIKEHATQMISLFINLVREKATQAMMSDIAKSKIKQDIQNKQVIDNAVTTGVINEEVMAALEHHEFKKE